MNVWATLKDWGRLVSLMEYSVHQQTLDSRESDLVWLLRSDNPRFRSTALKALQNLRYRSELLIAEIVRIIQDDQIDTDCRVLAVAALSHVARLEQSAAGRIEKQMLETERRTMLQSLLDRPLPSNVAEAVHRELADQPSPDWAEPTAAMRNKRRLSAGHV